MSQNINIKKAKIKDNIFLEVEYTEELQGHTKKDNKLSSTVPVHQDLKDAFQNLHKHLAVLCDEVKAPKKSDFELSQFPQFTVRGFSIGGSDDSEGVTISGAKDGKFGLVNLNSPFTKFESDSYPFTSDLSSDIMRCINEVEQYLFEGKRAPEQQLEMDFGEDAENENQ
jgi:hypothetical protein